MNTKDLTHLLQHPQTISAEQISNVRSIINEFPYFQSARAIYLKGLKNEGSFKYNQELKITAAYTTDRSILFDFITSDMFLQNTVSKHIKENQLKDFDVNDPEDISIHKSVVIDDALKQHIQDTEPVLDPELFQTKEEYNIANDTFGVDASNIETIPEEALEDDKPLDFSRSEVHSFAEWLQIASFKPIIRNPHDKEQSSKSNKFDLIDKFIANNPKIHPVDRENTKSRNIAKAQMIKPKSLMTETLARIYVEQKNYDKAIQSYKILSLKYPEKSGFFADQIKAVKKLQKNNI